MKKKCFKKTVSWALSIVMSATMAVTPVLADTFTDDSQSIISGNAEIPAVDVESDTNCGDTMGDSDCIEKELTEFQDPLFMEEDYGDAESARFSSGNDAEVVSDFYDDSVPAAQTEEKAVVYLDPTRGNNNNTGESDTAAVQTLSKALGLVAQNGVIYLLNPVTVDSQMTLSNVTFRPGKSNMLGMLYISGDVTLNNIKIYNETPDGRSCQFSNDPIRVTGTLTIGKGTRIESFLGKSCIYVSQGTLNLNGGKIQGDTQNTVKHGGGIYAKNATVNVYEGIISGHSAT